MYAIGFGSNYFHIFGENPNHYNYIVNGNHNHDKDKLSPWSLTKMTIPHLVPPNLINMPSKVTKPLQCQSRSFDTPDDEKETLSNNADVSFNNGTSSIAHIDVGSTNVTILTNDSTIYTLGTLCGFTCNVPKPLPTRLPIKCTKIAHGRRHVLAMMEGGSVVMSWGSDHFGQLGHGSSITHVDSPKIIKRLLPMYVSTAGLS